jgi:hypothetical protein
LSTNENYETTKGCEEIRSLFVLFTVPPCGESTAVIDGYLPLPQKLRLANFPPLAYFVPINSVSEDGSQADLDCPLVSTRHKENHS